VTAAAPLTATVILTAGESSRFGSPKQAALVNGRPVLTALLERLARPTHRSRASLCSGRRRTCSAISF